VIVIAFPPLLWRVAIYPCCVNVSFSISSHGFCKPDAIKNIFVSWQSMARKLFNQSGRRKKIARSTGAPCKPWARFLTTTSNYTIPTAAVAFPNLFGRGFFIARTIWNVDTAEPWWYSRKDRAERCIPDCLHWPRLRHKLSQQFQRAMESNGLMPGSTAVFAQAASGVAGSTVPANSILRRSRRTIISAANGGGKETQRRIFWDPLKGSMRDSPKRGEKSDGLDNQIKQTKQ